MSLGTFHWVLARTFESLPSEAWAAHVLLRVSGEGSGLWPALPVNSQLCSRSLNDDRGHPQPSGLEELEDCWLEPLLVRETVKRLAGLQSPETPVFTVALAVSFHDCRRLWNTRIGDQNQRCVLVWVLRGNSAHFLICSFNKYLWECTVCSGLVQ